MTRWLFLVVTLTLLAGACSTEALNGEDGLSGRLVVLDRAGNVTTVDPEGGLVSQITEDAGDGAVYVQPLWSPDGAHIAWGQVTADGSGLGISGPGGEAPILIPMGNPPFYLYWAPDSEAIGVLHNSSGAGIDFEIVDVAKAEAAVVDRGVPYYFSWSPDGNEVVVHVGETRFATIRRAGGRTDLGSTSPGYLAPHWVPGGIVHVVDDSLVMETDAGAVPLALVSGAAAFVANPQGSLVAVQSVLDVEGTPAGFRPQLAEAARIPVNKVVVVDPDTGGQTVAFDGPAVGFFWSPDGERLLILSVSPSGAALQPTVWERGQGPTEYPEFLPHGSFVREVLPFFPQYAQSLNLWSPDSTAFAYAGEVEGERGIWIQDLSEARPRFVVEGTWVAWSSR